MSRMRSVGLVLLASLVAAPLAAQRGLREVQQWGTGGLEFDFAVPWGVMSQFVDYAGGMDAFMAFDAGRGSPLALRLEGGLLVHQLSYDDHNSSMSYIGSFRLGPQMTVGPDGFRIYALALAGPSYFGTTISEYDCSCSSGSTTLSGDWTMGMEAGGGLMFGKRTRLDLGVRLVRHEDARYLAWSPGANGSDVYTQVRGPAEYVVFKVGITMAMR